MKQLSKLLIFIISACITAVSCYYDSEESLYPSLGSSCDTANVTFSITISGLLANNCLSCHSNSTAASFGNGIRLENYADVKSKADAVSDAINHNGNFSPMPKNGGKLNNCLIIQFDKWISEGTPDN
jgi:hypothetical protein